MQKRWVVREADENLVALLSQRLQVVPLIGRILLNRGLTDAGDAGRFLSSSLRSDLPSPFLMAGMEEAAERLLRALKGKEPICVWGDYDVDGTTGAATLICFLREVGGDANYYVPHRIDEGYGLNSRALRQLASSGTRLVVTVDCGISNLKEVELAVELGLDVVIVDHHELPDELPPAAAIVNPHRPDCRFPDKGLSGAGLAFYLIMALRAKLRDGGWFAESSEPDIRRCLDIVTLGTIADMVPLRGVNRVLTRRGLIELGGSTRPGIVALKQVARMAAGAVNAGQVAFQLGPRINAAGRMDAGLKVVEMLTTNSSEVALRIARELEENNRERQAMEARVLEEALREVETGSLGDRRSIVVGGEGWHPGVLGIVASRILERFHRPTIVVGFRDGEGKGSGRSIRGFHLVEGLKRCGDLLEKFGGHEYAAGLTIRQDKFSPFRDRFEEIARAGLQPEDLVPLLEVDAELKFSMIDFTLARQMDALKPFGVGNPEPLFLTRGAEIFERRDFNGGFRVKLRQSGRSLEAVAFKEKDLPLRPGGRVDVVYRLSENEWNGTRAVELRLVDGRASSL